MRRVEIRKRFEQVSKFQRIRKLSAVDSGSRTSRRSKLYRSDSWDPSLSVPPSPSSLSSLPLPPRRRRRRCRPAGRPTGRRGTGIGAICQSRYQQRNGCGRPCVDVLDANSIETSWRFGKCSPLRNFVAPPPPPPPPSVPRRRRCRHRRRRCYPHFQHHSNSRRHPRLASGIPDDSRRHGRFPISPSQPAGGPRGRTFGCSLARSLARSTDRSASLAPRLTLFPSRRAV